LKNKTIILIVSIAVIAVIAVVAFAQIFSEIQNPKIFCYAEEYTSFIRRSGGLTLDPYVVVENDSLHNVPLRMWIANNNSKSLFNVGVEVSYRTTENNWVTITKTDVSFIDTHSGKQTVVNLVNPYLSLLHTKEADYSGEETTWENVTVYVLDESDYKITAYGFAKP
jgi:hypothetical protein